MSRTYDAVVLGAGIAGSAMANVLAQAGWDIVLVDQDHFPRHKVCGEFLSPESARSLAALGLDETVQALGCKEIRKTRLIMAGGEVLELTLPGVAFGVSRYKLDLALHDSVREWGGEIQEEMLVKSVKKLDHTYVLHTRKNGEEMDIHSRTVIAAWGRNPRAGLTEGGGGKPVTHSFIGIKAHLRGVLLEGCVELYFFPGGYLGVSPVENDFVNIAALVTRQTFAEAGRTVTGVIKLAMRQCPKLAERLADSEIVNSTQVATAPVITNRKVMAWSLMAHLGDAAAIIPPLCGDGMAIALYSAEICAPLAHRYLQGKITLEQWEREYSSALLREIGGPIRFGRYLQSLLGSSLLGKLAVKIGSIAPGLAISLIKSTRLKR